MSSTTAPSFGSLLKRYRRAAGLTQEALADRAGLSARGVQDLERGVNRAPRHDTLELLAAALGLSGTEHAEFVSAASLQLPAAPHSLPPAACPLGGAASLYPLVGRHRELALLEQFLAGEGDPFRPVPLLVLSGEPGIGKTRLLEAATRRAIERGWCVLMGGCQRGAGQEPYAPVLEALARHLRLQTPARLQSILAGCTWLVRLLPELADSLEPLASGSLPPEQERRLLFAAVGRFLANVAGPAGTLLVLDDLQWAGADALALLATLLRDRPASLRVVGAHRAIDLSPDSPLGAVLADLAPAGLVRQHTLGPLDPTEAADLFRHLLMGVGPQQDVAVQHTLQRAGGVPFFLVSYAQALRQGNTEAVPWDLAQGVRQRVALAPAAREMLGVAAIIGRRVPRTLLMRVVGQSEEALLAGLEAACGARLLLEEGEEAYVFAHDVIREVVEADLGAARRAVLHRRVAEALESQPGAAPPEVLAYHYARSGLEEKAVVYLERAGDAARARSAHAGAAGYYWSALDQLRTDADRARVGWKLGTVLTAAGRYDEALTALERAAGDYRRAGDWDGEARAVAQLGEVHFRRGTVQEGLARVQTMLDALPASAPSGAAHLYVARARMGPRGEVLAVAQRAAELARQGQDDDILATAEALVAYGLQVSHRPEEALALYERLIPGYEATGDFASLCLGLTRRAHAHAALGAFGEARMDLERALAAAERIDDQPLIADVLELVGWHALIMGEWQAAAEYIGRFEEAARSLGTEHSPVTLLLLRGSLALYRGEWARATHDFEEAAGVALRTDEARWRAAQDKLVTRDLVTGNPAAALHRQERLDPHLDVDAAWGRLVARAEACVGVGNLEQAEEIVAEALARFRARDDRLREAELLRMQGMLLARQEQWEEAQRSFAGAISLAHHLPYPYLEAQCLYELGTMLAARGDAESALCRLQEALAIFLRLGARKDGERTERALAALGPVPARTAAVSRDQPS